MGNDRGMGAGAAMPDDPRAGLPYRPCVGVVLVNSDGHVFAGQRRDASAPAWQMPQGGIDPGETPRDAALRELEEETGVPRDHVEIVARTDDWLYYDLPADLVPKVWNGAFRGQKQQWFLMRLQGDDSRIDINTAHPEFSAWRWFEPEALIATIVPFKRAIYREVMDRFAPYLGPHPAARETP